MQTLDHAVLLAVHFHRSQNGEWYAVGNHRDKALGKNGQVIIARHIPADVMKQIIDLIAPLDALQEPPR